jgi:hypothetical protein
MKLWLKCFLNIQLNNLYRTLVVHFQLEFTYPKEPLQLQPVTNYKGHTFDQGSTSSHEGFISNFLVGKIK